MDMRKNKSNVILPILLVFSILVLGAYIVEKNDIVQVLNSISCMNWGLSFQEEGKAPVIDVSK